MAYCAWTGIPCVCTEFPYKRNGIIPACCEKIIVEQMIELAAVRAVSDTAKAKFKQYQADVKAGKYKDRE